MKLYIKTNNITILKNLENLLPRYNTKSMAFLDTNSPIEYITNIKTANILDKQKTTLFYDDRDLKNVVRGIYYGNSSCEHLLPSIYEITTAMHIANEKNLNFVFVFPALSEFSFENAKEICKALNQDGCEVVVNDFGTLHLVQEFKNLKIILGTNFTKVIKKAFDTTSTDDKIDILQDIEFEIAEVRKFYKELGISRLSVENLNLNLACLDEIPRMYVDIYYPYIYISHSKACNIASNFNHLNGTFVNNSCSKNCLSASCDFKNSDIFHFYQRYNTVYKPNEKLEIDKVIYRNKKNRLIWEIFL